MRAVLQRVSRASVSVGGECVASIGAGLLVLLGVARGDTESDLRTLAEKTAGLRIFEDGAGKMNLSVRDVGGQVLVVSQFTLLGDASRGRRPSFTAAAPPEEAKAHYEGFAAALGESGLDVRTGRFGEHMAVTLCNEGPVTILLESKRSP
jgi:D-tyrosyl-tRNA(Tyr) deacylase